MPADLEAPLAPAALTPLIVGVTSHRNLAAGEIDLLREQVRDFFASLRREFPELPLIVLSALAEGGDQLVAEVALEAGARLVAPLPLPPAAYAEDFGSAASRTGFAELSARAQVIQLPLLPRNTAAGIAVPGSQRDAQYAEAGVFIASHSHILLALWDGRGSDLLGGTDSLMIGKIVWDEFLSNTDWPVASAVAVALLLVLILPLLVAQRLQEARR